MKPKAVCAMLKVLPLKPMSLYMRYSKYFLYSIHGHGFRLGNIITRDYTTKGTPAHTGNLMVLWLPLY